MIDPDKVNILLVDDQPQKLLAYDAILAPLGETLLTADSGKQALEILLKHEIAVVLVDVVMPEMDGFEMATILRRHPRYQNIPIIFVSAISTSEIETVRGYKLGAVDYVCVPVVPEILRAKVAVFVDLYRKSRDLQALNRELEQRVTARTADLEKTLGALQDHTIRLEQEIAQRTRLEKELRDQTAQLAEADRRKDEFLAMLAHELRNPLTPVRTAIDLLRLKEPTEPVLKHARDVIDRQVSHMTRLVDDLLDVSRITRGKVQLQTEPVELANAVACALETARPLIESRKHELTITLPPKPVRLLADPTRLAQIIANLLNNAAKYTETGGRIWLAAEQQGNYVVLRVRDTGVGIPADVLPRVFELFAQADRTLDRSQGGLGIGLTLVRRLVEMHGGTVEASSPGPGLGSEFTLRLPTVPEIEPSQTVETPNAGILADSTGLRVLVVDDNVDVARTLAMVLVEVGHDVRTVHDGPAALEATGDLRPDIVFLDLGLPMMDGYEVARRMRRQPGGDSFMLVALSGYGQEEDLRRSRAAGFDLHLTKPVGLAVLEPLLASVKSVPLAEI
jgi:signal transduction histidine kinase